MFKNKILLIAAHPDDDILGCGGTIKKFTDIGADFRVIYIAEGSSSRFLQNESNSLIEKAINLRNSEAENALNVLGVSNCFFYNLPCGKLDQVSLLSIGQIIEKEISSFNPETVITNSGKDLNNDHRIVFQAALQAARPGVNNNVRHLLSFEVLSSSEWKFDSTFQPNYFENITDQLNFKIKAINKFTTELKPFPFPRSEDGIKALAMYRGLQSAFRYAESFEIIRSFSN